MTDRRAKILCTLGPASWDTDQIAALLEAGMNAVRLNFSHGSHEDHERSYRRVREQAALTKRAVAILGDLQGPKIRVGKIPDPGFTIRAGETLLISVDPSATIEPGRVTIDYPPLAEEIEPGQPILMDDGTLEFVVEKVQGGEISARALVDGVLKSRKGVNVPQTKLSLPSMTPKDEADLRFALELGVDFVALSFVRTPADLARARAIMDEAGRRVPLVAKIEHPRAVENLATIVEAAEGVMVARGDLGVEMGPEEVPMVQKRAIELCNARGKLVITATQMLDSMIRNPRPTRAEASDVANAILDGSDAIMLSGETATGAYPLLSVRTMDRIVRRTEQAERYWVDPPPDMQLGHTTNAVARSAANASRSLPDVKAIITYTGSGGIARLVSDYRPQVPIYAFTPNPATYQALALYWGVRPIRFAPSTPGGENIFIDLDHHFVETGMFAEGDRVVIALGWPIKAHTSVNMLKLHKVGETLRPPS